MTATRLTAGPPNPAGRALETIGARQKNQKKQKPKKPKTTASDNYLLFDRILLLETVQRRVRTGDFSWRAARREAVVTGEYELRMGLPIPPSSWWAMRSPGG